MTAKTESPAEAAEKEVLRARIRQLELDTTISARAASERDVSDQRYAFKLVERIVFAFIGLITVAVVGGMLALVLK